MAAVATTAASPPQWADLPEELLGNIARRLHAPADTVRFHAVCWAWREALYEVPEQKLLPWLLAPSSSAADGNQLEDQRCRCVFSKGTYLAPGICVRDRRVVFANGGAAGLVSGGLHKGVRLVCPLTADEYPGFPDECMGADKWLGHRHRIISGEGAVLLYDFDLNYSPDDLGCYPLQRQGRFQGHLLLSNNGRWMHVSSDLGTADRCCAASYHHGGFVVCVDLANCNVLHPCSAPIGSGYYIWVRSREVRAALPDDDQLAGRVRRSSYLVEFDGELLLASVLEEVGSSGSRLSVSLHELRLEKNNGGGGGQDDQPAVTVEWVRRDALVEHVLFLGFPGSFAEEANGFDGEVTGGTAYFVVEGDGSEPCNVYRYSFHDDTATLVDTLPPGWRDARCMWFTPNLKIQALFEEHEEAAEPAAGDLQGGGSDAWREQLRIYVGDLSPKVDNSRLREMFSVYGKVAKTRVAYDKRGRSRGFGFVTMATQDGFDTAIEALNGSW